MPDLSQAGYNKRRSWSDAQLNRVKTVLAQRFIAVSNFTQDTERGIDLIVPALTFGVRLRQMKYANYKDFTLRSSSGSDTSEYDKLLAGNGPDFLFYAYTDGADIMSGYLVDVQAWRLAVHLGEALPDSRTNKDGSSFVAFKFLPGYSEQLL